jgi:hypothetical protein
MPPSVNTNIKHDNAKALIGFLRDKDYRLFDLPNHNPKEANWLPAPKGASNLLMHVRF